MQTRIKIKIEKQIKKEKL